MTSKALLGKQVLAMFRACMRSARKCPAWEQREIMKSYVRRKFRAEQHCMDDIRIRGMLADAREELAQMDYYHSVYAEKQRIKAAQAQGHSETTAQSATCAACGSIFQPPTAKFCSECGAKRG